MTNAARAGLLAMSEASILTIHERSAIGRHRGTGIRSLARLRDLVADLHTAARERWEAADVIALIFDDIERDPQPFVDCNHRTALLLGRVVAAQFGLNLRFSGSEGKRLRRRWETMTRKDLKAWISEHLVSLERR